MGALKSGKTVKNAYSSLTQKLTDYKTTGKPGSSQQYTGLTPGGPVDPVSVARRKRPGGVNQAKQLGGAVTPLSQ